MFICLLASWEFRQLFLDVSAAKEQEGERAPEGEAPEHDDDPGGPGARQERGV